MLGLLTYHEISRMNNCTDRQVQYAIANRTTPQKNRRGRKPILGPEACENLYRWVCASRKNRRMPWEEIPKAIGWDVGVWAIAGALIRGGFKRHIARLKPPLTEENKARRLQWALDHVNWTPEQWLRILWTDETWVRDGRHTRTWVTRRKGETLDPTCLVDKLVKKIGWMFWGSFSFELGKGPCLFWEKEWGTINKDTYCEHIVPIIHGWIRLHPELILMQDGAPGHAAAQTLAELQDRGITLMEWPPYSPDLNPIEALWNKMKNYLQELYNDDPDRRLSYDRLRIEVQKAWDMITTEELQELAASMKDRCLAVIDAKGGHTLY